MEVGRIRRKCWGSREFGLLVFDVRCWLLAGLLGGLSLRAEEIHPPLGPYVNLREEHFAEARTYGAEDRLVLTPYFYWYEVGTGAHIHNGDGSDALTDHPATMEGFSYRSVAWHEGELRDMMAAGIQVVLPVYWGEPSQRLLNQPISAQPWSFSGLPPLVAAREALVREGLEPPRIGLFYDTSTLEYNVAGRKIDLTTTDGQQWFYETVRDFYSLIPPKHWAMVEGRPVVFLYSASFAVAHDQRCIESLREAFARDFGGRQPHVVREISWQVTTENVYAWGGALGLKNPGVASLGPGYDHSAVPGREPLVVDREGGAFFERNWIRFLRRPSSWVFIETWNEFHEGTDIAASREYGREYIELNRKYADMFQAGVRPPLPRGVYSDFKEVEIRLQATNETRGVVQVESADGVTEPAEVNGRSCRRAVPTANAGKYIYFRIDDSFKWADLMRVELEVEYLDGNGSFTVEFDGSDTNAPFAGAYTRPAQSVTMTGSGTWRKAVFRLAGARLLNAQNAGADFRIVIEAESFHIARVRVRRLGVPEEAGKVVSGWSQDFGVPVGTDWAWWGDGELPVPMEGMLRLRGGVGDPARLALVAPVVSSGVQELLARIRVARVPQPGERIGGVFVGGSTQSGGGIECQLRVNLSGAAELILRDPLIAEERVTVLAWEANRWYWLRLRHEPNDISGHPDVLARLWPADGETPESGAWLVWWDYYPRQAVRAGKVGLVGPGPTAGTDCECDFLLVRDASWPEAEVRLPGLKPRRARLTWLSPFGEAERELALLGTGDQGYQVESTVDFQVWSDRQRVFTDASGFVKIPGAADTGESRRFIRARVAD